jgi:hypothetical protein
MSVNKNLKLFKSASFSAEILEIELSFRTYQGMQSGGCVVRREANRSRPQLRKQA